MITPWCVLVLIAFVAASSADAAKGGKPGPPPGKAAPAATEEVSGEAAEAHGKSMSEWARDVLLSAAKRVAMSKGKTKKKARKKKRKS